MFRVEISFGVGKDKDGNVIPHVQHKLRQLGEKAAYVFGGYSLIPGEGGWVNDAGILVTEPGYILRIDRVQSPEIGRLFAVINVRDEFNQQCVVFSAVELTSEFI